jgi:hypothetical protein
VLGDEDDETVGRSDGEQVEHDRGRCDDDRSEDDGQEDEAEPEDEDEHERKPRVHRVDEVDVVGGVPADEDAHVGAAKSAGDLDRAQVPYGGQCLRTGLVAADLDADRCQVAAGRETQVASTEDRVALECSA